MTTFHLNNELTLKTIAIRIKNREKMIQFYRNVLGFHLTREENELVILGTRANKEMLWLEESPLATDFFGEIKKLCQLVLQVSTQNGFAHLVKRLLAADYPIKSSFETATCHSLIVVDPEGNELEIFFGTPGLPTEKKNQLNFAEWAEKALPDPADDVFVDELPAGTRFVTLQLNVLQEGHEGELFKGLGLTHPDGEPTDFQVILGEARGGTIEMPTDKVLGLDVLQFELVEEAFENLVQQLNAQKVEFFADDNHKIVTLFDTVGVEWWFLRQQPKSK
jgi:catechol 2,3-dioxygenase